MNLIKDSVVPPSESQTSKCCEHELATDYTTHNQHWVASFCVIFPVIVKVISGVLDTVFSRRSMLCQTFFPWMICKYQTFCVELLFSLPVIFHVLNTAGHNARQCLISLPNITRSLTDMSGMFSIFRDHCNLRPPDWTLKNFVRSHPMSRCCITHFFKWWRFIAKAQLLRK